MFPKSLDTKSVAVGAIVASVVWVSTGAMQQSPQGTDGRFQLQSSWSQMTPDGSTREHGTYRIDTQTGTVYEIRGESIREVK